MVWKYPHTLDSADVYTDQAGLWDTVAWCHLRPSIFPHSHRVRLMPHMCSTCTAVLFYSKSYQHMKGWRAQRGVSWHQRAEVRQEGKSQIVEASHMCCTSDEKLRCKTVVLFQFFSNTSLVTALDEKRLLFLNSWRSLVLFCCLVLCWQAQAEQISPWGPTVTLYSWKAHALDWRNSSYANKMVALKVPVVQCAL